LGLVDNGCPMAIVKSNGWAINRSYRILRTLQIQKSTCLPISGFSFLAAESGAGKCQGDGYNYKRDQDRFHFNLRTSTPRFYIKL